MRYEGSEAVRLDGAEVRQPERRASERSFQVLPGGGLDARARQGVSPQFVANLKLCVIAVMVLVIVGGIRVALSTATVSSLKAASSLRSEISEAEDTNAELQVELSVDSSTQRIIRIATQNYGMVLATSVDSIDIGSASQSEVDTQEDTTDAQATDDSSADTSQQSGESSVDQSASADTNSNANVTSETDSSSESSDTDGSSSGQEDIDSSTLSPSNAGANAVTEAELENAA